MRQLIAAILILSGVVLCAQEMALPFFTPPQQSSGPASFYVDSVAGNDSTGNGTISTPYATLAKLTNFNTVGANIYLKRGSVFRESFEVPTNSMVDAYSVGPKPIISGADLLVNANFSLTSGKTKTYEYAYTCPTETNNEAGITHHQVMMVWENSVRMGAQWQKNSGYNATPATAITQVEANAGSFYYDTNANKLYIHIVGDGNPASNSKVYEASVRTLAVYGGDGFTVSNIRAEKSYNWNQGGQQGYAILGRASGTYKRCQGGYSWNHAIGVANQTNTASPLVFDSCYAFDCEYQNDSSPTLFIGYKDVAGSVNTVVFTNCLAAQPTLNVSYPLMGYHAHDSAGAFSADRVRVQVLNCFAANVYNGFDFGSNKVSAFKGNTALNCNTSFLLTDATPIDTCTSYWAVAASVDTSAPGAKPIVNSEFLGPKIYSDKGDLCITNCILANTNLASAAGSLVGVATTYKYNLWSNSFFGSYIQIDFGSVNSGDYNNYFGFGRSIARDLDSPSPGFFDTLTDWKAAASPIDAHSTGTDPGYSDSFYRFALVDPSSDIPTITSDPASQSVLVGDSPIFSVTAVGPPTILYQWRKSGAAIGGATTTSYTFSNAQLTDSGATFDCIATNNNGAVTSAVATLTVSAPYVLSPTNLPGYAALGWWCVSSNYNTNASTAILPDLSGNHNDLTNMGSVGTWPKRQPALLNGLDVLWFTSADMLQSIVPKVEQPFEIAWVCSMTNIGAGNRCFWSGTNGTTRAEFYNSSGGEIIPYGGNTFSSIGLLPTNKFVVYNSIYNSSLTAYTNNTAMGGGSSGSAALYGLIWNARQGDTAFSYEALAEVVLYPTNLTIPVRSNLFYYLTNKYNISP